MKEENKELLLKDLCGRLPYGVKIRIEYPFLEEEEWHSEILYGLDLQRLCIANTSIRLEEFKPYLFPLSSMSTSEMNEITDILGCDFPWSISEGKLTWTVGGSVESELFELTIDQLERIMHIFNSRHYDYRGLIGKHLANDATGLGIYKEG